MDAVLSPLPCASSSLLPCAHNSSKHLPSSSPSSGVGLPPLPHRPLRCRASLRREISPALRESSISPLPRRSFGTRATAPFSDDLEVLPVSSNDPTDQQQGSSLLVGMESEENSPLGGSLSGFSPDPPFTFDLSTAAATGGVTASTSGAGSSSSVGNDIQVLAAAAQIEADRLLADRAVNALIVGAAGAFAVAKILTVDHDYWQGWTLFEILKYAPLHNWSAYEEALKSNPVLAKMMISGIVYSVGDWIAQCYEGKPVLDFSRERVIRSGLVGFCLHGSLSHYYYHFCEAIFPFKDWWVVPLKVAFDQTIWSGFWNSVYFVVLGLLRFESPVTIAAELRSTFWPLLTAGWKLWPFAHLVTYGLIPVEQRLLWVDCVELVWVTILSMYSNEKAEARILEAANELNGNDSATVVLPPMDVNAEGNAEVVE